MKIRNLNTEENRRIRLIPSDGATSELTGITGAVTKEVDGTLSLCLSPSLPNDGNENDDSGT